MSNNKQCTKYIQPLMINPFVYIFFIIHIIGFACESNKTETNIASAAIASDEIVFRVVNGKLAKPGDIPWQVGFMQRYKRLYRVFCGGAIVRPRTIITAAHCFEGLHPAVCNPGKITRQALRNYVAVGGHLPAFNTGPHPDSDKGQWRRLLIAYYHEKKDFPDYDICVVKTILPFSLNDFVHPIPMATIRQDYNLECLTSGYGLINETTLSDNLLLAEVMTISIKRCNKIHGRDMSNFVCSSDVVSDVHKGDSGGPLVCKGVDPADRGEGVLVGVVGGKLQYVNSSSFYTRITSHLKFIESRASCYNCSMLFLIFMIVIHNVLALF